MAMKNSKDSLDSLLFAAAKNAGKNDIMEYNSTSGLTKLPDELSDKLDEIIKKKSSPSKGHLSFKRRIAIIAAAALLICGLTVGSIASRKQSVADIKVITSSNDYILSFDTTGIKSGGEISEFVPASLSKQYNYIGNTDDGSSRIYEKDGTIVTYKVTKLTSSYRLILGSKDDTSWFEVLIDGKYTGCAAVTKKDGVQISVVSWNDGACVYELMSDMDIYELCSLAE